MIRKEFIKYLGVVPMFVANPKLLAGQTTIEKSKNKMKKEPNYFEDELVDNSSIVGPEEGEKLSLNGISVTFKVTSELSNNQLGVYEITLPPKTIGAKLHYHRFMDETFIVKEGTLTLEVGDSEQKATPGTVAYVPRFTPHGFRNDSKDVVKLLLLFNPSEKREGFFRGLYETLNEVPINPEKYLKLYNKYDSFPVDTSNMLPIRD